MRPRAGKGGELWGGDITDLGHWLVALGVAVALIGALLMIVGRFVGSWRLPGDLIWQRGGVKVFAPLGTMLLLSLLLTIVLNIIAHWRR